MSTNVAELAQEPGINGRDFVDFFQAHAGQNSLAQGEETPGIGGAEPGDKFAPFRQGGAEGAAQTGAPISSERSPFCRASLNVRPMAMVSPTLFMEVVSSSFEPGNFSKVKRGIFTTQ